MSTAPRLRAQPATSDAPVVRKVRRGRPSVERVGLIDRAIIETARALFIAEGFDAVGMKNVAERAQISKGTLYARYPSKEALFCAIVETSVREWSEEASHADAQLTEDIEQRLRHHARTIAKWLARPDVIALQNIVYTVESRLPALAQILRREGYDYIVGLIAADITAAAERDGRSVRDPLSVARMIVGALSGVQLQERHDDAEHLLILADRLIDVVMQGRQAW